MAYHHGIESQDAESFGYAQESNITVVGLIGTAPMSTVGVDKRTVNEIVLINSAESAIEYFGNKAEGFTLPDALETLFSVENPPVCLVINVFDLAQHANIGAVNNSDLIGSISTETGIKTGLLKFYDAQSELKMKPRFIHAPVFNQSADVVTAITNLCDKLRARTSIDCPKDKTVSQAISKRNAENDPFNTLSNRVRLHYPHVKYTDTNASEGYVLRPLSTENLAAWINIINQKGYQYSPSNTSAILDANGLESPITFDAKDPACDANLLNAQGITTVISGNNIGYRAWGNRNASFPSKNDLLSFDCVLLVDDIIADAIEENSLQYIDLPLNPALIQEIMDSGNRFLKRLKGEGKIHDGELFFEPKRNENLSPGELVISRRIAPVVPLEKLTYVNKREYYTTTQLLKLSSY